MPDFCKDISFVPALDKCVVKWYNKEIADKIFYTNAHNFYNFVRTLQLGKNVATSLERYNFVRMLQLLGKTDT